MPKFRMKRMQPFFPYFGSKWNLSQKYYPIPLHGCIIEPFAGSASYSTKWYDRKVMLADLNPRVVGTWDFLMRSSQSNIMGLPLNVESVDDIKCCQEAKWLIGWWMRHSYPEPGITGTSWYKNKTSPDNYWGSIVRARIATQVDKIRHWKVKLCSFEQLVNVKATWFIDPPYQQSGKLYTFHRVDYEKLGRWTKSRNGAVIACGQESDDWISFRKFAKINSVCKSMTQEMIWTKGFEDAET